MSAVVGPTEAELVVRTRAAWGDIAPAWVLALAEACAAESQARVAVRIGYSAATVNQVLKNSYGADLDKVAARVRGALMAETVDCPVLGELATDRCIEEQSRPFVATSGLRARLWRACRGGCPHSRLQQGGSR